MYTRWRLYILALFLAIIAGTWLVIRFLRKRGVSISRWQAALAIVGVVLISETLMVTQLSNFNLGVILPAFFGAPMLLCAILLPKMRSGFLCALKIVIIVCYCVAGAIFAVCGALMLSAQHDAKSVEADAVIVLGAAVHGDKVTWVLENRLNRAIEFMNAHPDAICVVSGGQGAGETVTEASAMKKYMVGQGIADERVYMEEHATNTMGNFAFSMEIIGDALGKDARVAFVTTDFHVFRAGAVARAMGYAVTGIPAEDVWYLRLNNFLRECVGICTYALLNRI